MYINPGLTVFIFLIALNSVKGYKFVLDWSTPKAVLGEPYTFTCYVTQAAGLEDYVVFRRKPFELNMPGVIKQKKKGGCTTEDQIGYTTSCFAGTDTESSSTKVYRLTIEKVSGDDLTGWLCSHNKPADNYKWSGTGSEILYLRANNFSFRLVGSQRYAVLGRPYTLTCIVSRADTLRYYVVFRRKPFEHETPGVLFQMERGGCVAVHAYRGYSLICGAGTSEQTSTTKRYKLIIGKVTRDDVTDWKCHHNSLSDNFKWDGEGSNTFTMESHMLSKPARSSAKSILPFVMAIILICCELVAVVVFNS
ncbi:uncharacterized protein LOC121382289 [Gigantopelta aegis]|uniref:uncharacterized protein LOC121382289 n=1 Tax=Gigantopelta aegis TaxID=1735272 RepID=UPI001B88C5D3|nr:uncharacterized protein LOC121382289 [Gigantopelta aegis]XP_041367803.1 uncharacterized protein LOC121382289 [Gigantopelta aegis]